MNPYIIPGLPNKSNLTERIIINAVLTNSGLTENDLFSRSRKGSIPDHRHVCMWALRRYLGIKLKSIAELFGGRDHTTVIHSVKIVDNLLQTNDFQIVTIVQRIKNYQSIKTITNEVS